MKILVANIGSTSLKYKLFEFSEQEERLLARGGFERVIDYPRAVADCLAQLRQGGWLQKEGDLAAVGFKTVMARDITGCVQLDDRVLGAMEAYSGVAPAHNPPYIAGIRHFLKQMPGTPMIGLFETAFYQWVPEAATRYAVPEDWHERGIRRYGFHGASHKYIAERSAELLARKDVARRARELYVRGAEDPIDGPDLRVISCHFGGSSSITGIRNGAAIGSSMGFSPQSGLPQNNRVGDLDPFAISFMMRQAGLGVDEVERLLCQESGLKGLSGGANDFRDILALSIRGNQRAQLAIDVFAQAARHWIGAFYWELDGADALVFTAGIGENQPALRQAICRGLGRIGLELDDRRNQEVLGREGEISSSGSRIQVMVIPTNEELMVAREARRLLLSRDSEGRLEPVGGSPAAELSEGNPNQETKGSPPEASRKA